MVLSLSLFIILLAFFMVMNGLSEFSKPKADQAFDSLDIAFSANIVPTDFIKTSPLAVSDMQEGAGDAVEEMQGVLRSILPDLNMTVSPNPNGGNVMQIRIQKTHFERVSADMIPLFNRVLLQKDQKQLYGITLTSYVRDPLSDGARTSFDFIRAYADRMKEAGLPSYRVSLEVEQGNPAIMAIDFAPFDGGGDE